MSTAEKNGISQHQLRPDSDFSLPARRRSELLKVAKTRGSITVTEIASEFAVSADTIRRDLDYLAGRGLLTRTHGGAVPVDGFVDRDTPVALRVNARAAEKARIARAAAALIADGEALIINGGSTTRAFVGELGALRNLTIVTNNLGVPGADSAEYRPAASICSAAMSGWSCRSPSARSVSPTPGRSAPTPPSSASAACPRAGCRPPCSRSRR